jgi:hypothetical protein
MPPSPLTQLSYSYEEKSWSVHDLVVQVKADSVQDDSIKNTLEKPTKRALRRGDQRTDLGSPPPGTPEWATLVKRARRSGDPALSQSAATEPPLVRIKKNVFNSSFILRETQARTQQRQELKSRIAHVLQGITSMSWRKWKNPFETVRERIHPRSVPATSCPLPVPLLTQPFCCSQEITRENHVAIGLTQYFDVISDAMSLPQIQRRADGDDYRTFKAFEADVSLMVKNAQTFNRPGEPVHGMAGDLWEKFVKLKQSER